MDTVFISYSRRDQDFVRRVHAALADRGHDAWVDWDGIPPSDSWMVTIRTAIDAAEAVVFVLSPDWITSEICQQELDHAVARNKRLIPVLHRESDQPAPPVLAVLNYVFGRVEDDFERFADTLAAAIETDLDWVRAHTRLLIRAAEWDREGREVSFTLRGADLTAFEDWIARAPAKEPKPTALQAEYLLTSRRAATRRQQITWAAVAGGLVIASVLGMIAWSQKAESDRQEQIVEARQLLTRAAFLRDAPPEDEASLANYDRSVRFAAQALGALDQLGGDVRDADLSLRKSIARRIPWQRHKTKDAKIVDAAFTRDGLRMGLAFAGDGVSLFDTVSGAEIAACNPDAAAGPEQQLSPIAVSDDAGALAAVERPATANSRSTRVRLWALPSCEILLETEMPLTGTSMPPVRQMALSGDGEHLILLLQQELRILTRLGERIDPTMRPNSRLRRFALSPDGTRIALYETWKTDEVREYDLIVWTLANSSDLRRLRLAEGARDLRWRYDGFWINGRRMVEREGVLEPESEALFSAQAVLSADGTLMATAEKDDPIVIAETATGRVLAEIPKHSAAARLAFLPEAGRIVVLEPNKRELGLLDYDGASTAFAVLQSRPLLMEGIGFSADSAVLLAGVGSKRLGWRMSERPEGALPERIEPGAESPVPFFGVGAPEPGGAARFASELTGLEGRRYRLVESEFTRGGAKRSLELVVGGEVVASRELRPMLDMPRSRILTVTGWGRFLVHAENDGLHILDAATLEPVAVPPHRRAITAALTRDGGLAATLDASGEVRLYDLDRATEERRFPVDRVGQRLELSDDGRWLAVQVSAAEADLYALAPPDLMAQACRGLRQPCPGGHELAR